MPSKQHWETVYSSKSTTEVSWFQAQARLSLQIIQDAALPPDAAIIDVGSGASTLVDDLLNRGYTNITQLDISGAALAASQARLGGLANHVQWLEADVLNAALPRHAFGLWHDRAVFHFLITPEERRVYVERVRYAVKPDGLVMIATFSESGPQQCSGLPIQRYSENALQAEFGQGFDLIRQERESHKTPAGNMQAFLYCLFRKR